MFPLPKNVQTSKIIVFNYVDAFLYISDPQKWLRGNNFVLRSTGKKINIPNPFKFSEIQYKFHFWHDTK